jgi:hypothetical protein
MAILLGSHTANVPNSFPEIEEKPREKAAERRR